jgi:hypothetical protein
VSKTALLRFSTEDEKKEAVRTATKVRRSLNSYVMMLIHQDVQRLKNSEKNALTLAVGQEPPAQTEAGHRH